tara:strand:+ start:336 stop:755 length:420 start_codon:yes stop_codon:yes gene_type:complete
MAFGHTALSAVRRLRGNTHNTQAKRGFTLRNQNKSMYGTGVGTGSGSAIFGNMASTRRGGTSGSAIFGNLASRPRFTGQKGYSFNLRSRTSRPTTIRGGTWGSRMRKRNITAAKNVWSARKRSLMSRAEARDNWMPSYI